MAKLGTYFGRHPLVLEDIVNTGHRPNMEDAGDHIFIVLKMLYSGAGQVQSGRGVPIHVVT